MKVVIILGTGRNGSTLLSQILGNNENYLNVGELLRFISGDKFFRSTNEQICGCGQSIKKCDFWEEFLASVKINPVTQKSFSLFRYVSTFVTGKKSSRSSLEQTQRAFDYFSQKKAPQFLIESTSYLPIYHHCLKKLDSPHDIYVINLVRDPRQVALSWSRKKGYLKQMRFYNALFRALLLTFFNSLAFRKQPKITVKYEDLVSNHESVMKKIYHFLGDKAERDIRNDYEFDSQHVLLGNPGKSENHISLEYRKLAFKSKLQHTLSSLLSFPVLVGLKYRW